MVFFLSFLILRNFSIISSFPSIFFSSVFYIPYLTIFAVNLSKSSFENFFLLFFFSCYLTFSAFFLYSLLNSLTSSFVFFRFSLLSQVSSSTIYPFHCTKNFFFLLAQSCEGLGLNQSSCLERTQ